MISESRPWKSKAIAVQPDQVKQMNEDLQKRGVNAEYKPDGTFCAYSRKARNQELEARGYHDKDAGYGDYAGR